MREINLKELEENFDEIMEQIINGEKFLLRTEKNEGIILTPQVDQSIQYGINSGVIQEYK